MRASEGVRRVAELRPGQSGIVRNQTHKHRLVCVPRVTKFRQRGHVHRAIVHVRDQQIFEQPRLLFRSNAAPSAGREMDLADGINSSRVAGRAE